MNIYIDENLLPFFSESFLTEEGIQKLTDESILKQTSGVVLSAELNAYRTPSHQAIFENLGLNVAFVSLPAEGVWYLDETEIRHKKWQEVLKKFRKQTKPFAYRYDLNANRLRRA